jgi:hypothetical protein
MTDGPRMRDLRLSRRQADRRRMVKIQRHGKVKGARPIFWCGYCERYSYDLQVHKCKTVEVPA